MEDFDPAALAEYRRVRKDANPTAPELAYSDEELLRALGAVVHKIGTPVPTIAGIVLFGKHAAIRRLFPLMRVDYIRVPGREWVPQPDERFESVDMLGPLMLLIPRVINAILDDIPRAFHLPTEANRRKDVPLIPRMVVREAVVNALMHRSYRQRQPVQIIRYANRLEIRNPGHSLVPEERLGEPGSLSRNEKIAAVLHETAYAENKGSGIRAMREALENAGLTPPTFDSDRASDRFVVTLLFHHFLNAEDVKWLGQFKAAELSEDEAKALVFAREVGVINNVAYRDLNRVETLVASGHLRRLRDEGLLEQKGKSSGTYYVPTARLLAKPAGLRSAASEANPIEKGQPMGLAPSTLAQSGAAAPALTDQAGLTPAPTAQSRGLTPSTAAQSRGLALPPELATLVAQPRTRANHQQIKTLLVALCRWQPLRAEQLASIVGRSQVYLAHTFLGPLVRDGELAYLYPDNPAHPQQAYRAGEKNE